MKRKYTIDVFGGGLSEFAKGVEEYSKWIVERSNELIKRLTDYGVTVANAGFESAVYDGTNDFSVSFEERGEMKRAVVAVGATVLFVEFGTGVMYADNHPDKPSEVAPRGTYGKGYGKRNTWAYEGEPGSNGQTITNARGKSIVLTHGNPANMPMYNARKAIEQDIATIAREVFSY